jgi:dTDP-4-dehydrorhamnose 3,5-epimerase
MKIIATEISGLIIIEPNLFFDPRGVFFKTFNKEVFSDLGLNTDWKEEYFSSSNKNVLRGLHFQIPPHDHVKLVTCVEGAVLDVVVDLRKNSASFKKVFSIELNSSNRKQLLIPKGLAHGFLSLKKKSIMFYKVSSVYSQSSDSGILWNSIDFDWPIENPIISSRDKSHQILKFFNSPFLL